MVVASGDENSRGIGRARSKREGKRERAKREDPSPNGSDGLQTKRRITKLRTTILEFRTTVRISTIEQTSGVIRTSKQSSNEFGITKSVIGNTPTRYRGKASTDVDKEACGFGGGGKSELLTKYSKPWSKP